MSFPLGMFRNFGGSEEPEKGGPAPGWMVLAAVILIILLAVCEGSKPL